MSLSAEPTPLPTPPSEHAPAFAEDPIERAVADIAAGKPVVVLDAVDRENEGDLIMAAEHATPEWVGFFVRYGSGLICAPLTAERADFLALPEMVARNQDSLRTCYTVTVDAAKGTTTGISAADRSRTLQLLAALDATGEDFNRPGHVLPLRARPGGVLERPGHTEAAVDLCALAGGTPAGVIVELVHDDGSMRRGIECREFADAHGLALITVESLRAHLAERMPLVRPGATSSLPTDAGTFTAQVFTTTAGVEHVLLTMGDVTGEDAVLTRVHSECLTGDALGSRRCDCGPQLQSSLRAIAERGCGAVAYLRDHEGRGVGLAAKIAAYALQDSGADTVEANQRLGLPVDARSYADAAAMLQHAGVQSVVLLTNNPAKMHGLEAAGMRVAGCRPSVVAVTPENYQYLKTKVERMGHSIPIVDPVMDEEQHA